MSFREKKTVGTIFKGFYHFETWRWDRDFVPKRQYEIAILRCVMPEKSAEDWNHASRYIMSFKYMGNNLRNKNFIYEYINSRLNYANDCQDLV